MYLHATNPSTALRVKSKGQVLVITLILMTVLCLAIAAVTSMVFSGSKSAELFVDKEKAFYIAEAGIEKAKSILANNEYWFTDSPHSPDDDANWVISGANGSVADLGGGSYKMVRSSGSDIVYSVGRFKEATAVVRVKFDGTGKTEEFKVF